MFSVKKNLPVFVGLGLMCLSYTTSKLLKDPDAPLSYTGAPKAVTPNLGQVRYCSNSGCHSDFALNTAGGSVVATGLPSGTYSAGQAYNFSIKITYSAVNKVSWGFAIKAVNTVDNDVVGTFSTTNANASVKGSAGAKTSELGHSNAPGTTAASTYTFTNLTWTAPAMPNANQTNIRFYIVGVACDGDGSESGDYVYSSTVDASVGALPVSLKSFNITTNDNKQVSIAWQTTQEINAGSFEIETSLNGTEWSKIASVVSKVNASTTQSYSFTDKSPLAYNGNIYYRLKMVDQDGGFRYSQVETIKLKNAGILISCLSAQPLQADKNVLFKIQTDVSKMIMVTVADINGRLLYSSGKMMGVGVGTIEIPAQKITTAKGIVLVKFNADGFEKTFRKIIN